MLKSLDGSIIAIIILLIILVQVYDKSRNRLNYKNIAITKCLLYIIVHVPVPEEIRRCLYE
jgi:hypothetical protein